MRKSNAERKRRAVIFEPGYALLQEPIDYLMRIIDRKTVGDAQILTCDGTRMDIDPFSRRRENNKKEARCISTREASVR